MKIIASLVVILCLVLIATASSCSKDDFESFKAKFARTYYDDAEEARRYENFCNTIKKKTKDLKKNSPLLNGESLNSLTGLKKNSRASLLSANPMENHRTQQHKPSTVELHQAATAGCLTAQV